jgi:hypothetical protein
VQVFVFVGAQLLQRSMDRGLVLELREPVHER